MHLNLHSFSNTVDISCIHLAPNKVKNGVWSVTVTEQLQEKKKKTVKENHSFLGTAEGRDLNTSVSVVTNCIHPLQRAKGD